MPRRLPATYRDLAAAVDQFVVEHRRHGGLHRVEWYLTEPDPAGVTAWVLSHAAVVVHPVQGHPWSLPEVRMRLHSTMDGSVAMLTVATGALRALPATGVQIPADDTHVVYRYTPTECPMPGMGARQRFVPNPTL